MVRSNYSFGWSRITQFGFLALVVLVMLFSGKSVFAGYLGGTYYIDAENGNDTSTGKSEATAWKSFNMVNKNLLTAGTKIYLKKGSVWNQRLEIRGSGIATNWITVGAYGSGDSRPKIALTNHKDDIAILICDLDKTSGTARQQKISYIEIKDLEISDTRLGIYYRSFAGTENTGFRVKNVVFNNINCDEVMIACNTGANMTEKNAQITAQLRAVKGNLQTISGDNNGGSTEYIFPSAIFVGGQTFSPQRVDGNHTTVLTEFEVSDCVFNEAISGIISVFYWPFRAGDGANVWRQLIHKIRITNCSATGVVNGAIALDGVNAGAVPDANGVMQPDANGWGLVENMNVTKGSAVPGRTWPNGTTGLILSNCQNFLFDSCQFSNILNQGNPDGCGFDFETNTNQVTIQNTKFFDNDGHSILLMNGGNFGGNTNLVIQKNLFAGNVKSSNSAYELLLAQQYDGSGVHKNVKIRNNIAFMRKKNKDNMDIRFYETNKRGYVTATDNDLYYLEPTASEISVSFLGQLYSYNAQVSLVAIPVISVISATKNTTDSTPNAIQIYTEITKSSPTWYMASENQDFVGASWETYNASINFTCSPGSGMKTIYYKVKNAAGESSSVSVVYELITSIDNLNVSNSNSSRIKVFPNPVSAVVNVALVNSISGKEELMDDNDSYQVKLFDYMGKILEQSMKYGGSFQLDLSGYPVGMYVIRITKDENVYSKTIIKN